MIHATRIDHVQVNVTDLSRAKNFYTNVLGLEEIPRPPSFDFPGCWYRIGNADLHLVVRDAEPPSARHFCLWVPDLAQAATALEGAGLKLQRNARGTIPGVARFFVFDPDGNRIEIQGPDGTDGSLKSQI
jgi:catechol 2,3-dioxygenase-like lactoylglutathione lyase family enzyme